MKFVTSCSNQKPEYKPAIGSNQCNLGFFKDSCSEDKEEINPEAYSKLLQVKRQSDVVRKHLHIKVDNEEIENKKTTSSSGAELRNGQANNEDYEMSKEDTLQDKDRS